MLGYRTMKFPVVRIARLLGAVLYTSCMLPVSLMKLLPLVRTHRRRQSVRDAVGTLMKWLVLAMSELTTSCKGCILNL